MNWAFSVGLILIATCVFGQVADSTKPVLAFGPWFKKKISAAQPYSKVEMDSSKLSFYRPQAKRLKESVSVLETGNDSTWRSFIHSYEALLNQIKGDRSIEPYIITDEFLNQLIMLASRARMPLIANALIQESKRIHPTGTYRTNLNCKHE